MMKKNDTFTIPQITLKQLNEFSYGGFVLFNFDANGNPRVYSCCDNPVNFLAIQQHIENYIGAMQEIGIQEVVDSVIASDKKRPGRPPKKDKPDEPQE